MRIVAQLIGTLLLVGFVLKYWWLIALVLWQLSRRGSARRRCGQAAKPR
jgi:hypothetical protein